jgi:hypothetical protein
MDRLGAGSLGGGDDLFGDQIAFPRGGRTDQDRAVGVGHMGGVRVGLGVDRDGLKAHAAGRGEDPAGDFTAIGDQDGFEHGSGVLNAP